MKSLKKYYTMEKIILDGYTPNQFADLLKTIVREEFEMFNKKQLEEKHLRLSEVGNLFYPPLSRPTVNRLREEGTIKEYDFGGIMCFKYTQVVSAIREIKKYERRQVKNLSELKK